jgi:formate hydrogenlyase subunit 6/NADH:ubiquinone oxidoreductase subunit I
MLGTGLLKGLAVTARNFVGSYHDPRPVTTVEYPEEARLPENAYRNFPFLVFDGEDPLGLRCVACQICEKECPPQCIYIVMDRDEKGKAKMKPKVFDIDTSVCMSCQICVEVCPFDAIKMPKPRRGRRRKPRPSPRPRPNRSRRKPRRQDPAGEFRYEGFRAIEVLAPPSAIGSNRGVREEAAAGKAPAGPAQMFSALKVVFSSKLFTRSEELRALAR